MDSTTRGVPHVPFLEARDLQRSFEGGRVQALRGLSFCVEGGELVALIGPSGSGKSTLLQLLGALDQPTVGDVLFEGQSLRSLRDLARFRARTVGFVFQSSCLLPTLSALENVQVPMLEMPWRARECRRRASELLEAVGLGARGDHLPSQLSGGERQRVAIARGLANQPRLLLADEPTGNLDSESSRQILELLQKIHCEHGMTLVLVTHDPEVARFAVRRLQLLDGLLVSDERRPQVAREPEGHAESS